MTDQENTISKIRSLLDALETEISEGDESSFSHNFDALEIPSIVSSIVDYLQPQLLPYEAAIYWYIFRRSILASGEQYARVSVRGMQQGALSHQAAAKHHLLAIVRSRTRFLVLKRKVSLPRQAIQLGKVLLTRSISRKKLPFASN